MPFPLSPDNYLFDFDMETSIEVVRTDAHTWQKHINNSRGYNDFNGSEVKNGDHVYSSSTKFKLEQGLTFIIA